MLPRARTALILCLRLALGLTAFRAAAASDVSTNAPEVKRVVHEYALTSANDFPGRDPQDWRLLASNDGGKSWDILDVRKGEIFTERHQRRVFSCTNETAYNFYRLAIDR